MLAALVPDPPVVAGVATLPDLLRLAAVPALGWAAWRDYQIRRVNADLLLGPLVVVGALLLVWEGLVALRGPRLAAQVFLFRAGFSLLVFVPMAYLLRWRELFGRADTVTFISLAVLFPTYPAYAVAGTVFPVVRPPVWIFALTVLTNGAIVGLFYPVVLVLRNLTRRDVSLVMPLAKRVRWTSIPETHGRLYESPDGLTVHGLDLDALRMYLRWRGLALTDLRDRPTELRDPASLPDSFDDPTDGGPDPAERLDPDLVDDAAGVDPDPFEFGDDWEYADAWGAELFLENVGSAYGTRPDQLRDGLELLGRAEHVWVSPGLPYLVPVFAGLLVGLGYGDVLFAVLGGLG